MSQLASDSSIDPVFLVIGRFVKELRYDVGILKGPILQTEFTSHEFRGHNPISKNGLTLTPIPPSAAFKVKTKFIAPIRAFTR